MTNRRCSTIPVARSTYEPGRNADTSMGCPASGAVGRATTLRIGVVRVNRRLRSPLAGGQAFWTAQKEALG